MTAPLKAYRITIVTAEDVANGAAKGKIVFLHSEAEDGLFNFIETPTSDEGIPLFMQQVERAAAFDVALTETTPEPGEYVVSETAALSDPGPVEPAPETRGAGLKFDAGKPQPRLLFEGVPLALQEVVATLTFGAKKYSAHSWQEVEKADERYQDASYRHDMQRCQGELRDPETGIRHRAHHIINELFLLELELRAERDRGAE